MKTFITAMIIAAALVGGGIWFNNSIDAVADELMAECDEIGKLIDEGDFETAAEEISQMIDYVDKKKIVLASIINHENIDDIELCISELEGYTESKITAEARVRCKRLHHLLEHLPANYKVKPQNIL